MALYATPYSVAERKANEYHKYNNTRDNNIFGIYNGEEAEKMMLKKRINVEISEDEHREFKSRCYAEGKTITEKLVEWVRDFLRGFKE